MVPQLSVPEVMVPPAGPAREARGEAGEQARAEEGKKIAQSDARCAREGPAVAFDHEGTARAFFKAVERNDFETLGELVASDYIAIAEAARVLAAPSSPLSSQRVPTTWGSMGTGPRR
jgi:hypothetical protein